MTRTSSHTPSTACSAVALFATALLAACGKTPSDAPAASSAIASPSGAATKSLNCHTVRDALDRETRFLDSANPAALADVGTDACEIATDLVAHHRRVAERGFEEICESLGGPAGLARITDILSRTSPEEIEADPKLKRLVAMHAKCIGAPEERLKLGIRDMAPVVYSIGQIDLNGTRCPAYLFQLSSTKLDSINYGARLLGSCAAANGQVGNLRTPELGNLLTALGYTGALPTQDRFQGTDRTFVTQSTAPSSTTPSGQGSGASEIPSQFVGVWEQDASSCASARELGGATDAGVQITAKEIGSAFMGCTLRSVAASSADAFMGVFDCSEEGETSEATRSLRLSDGRLFLDQSMSPYVRCDVTVPATTTAPVESRPVATTPPSAPTADGYQLSADDRAVVAYAQELSAHWRRTGPCEAMRQNMLMVSTTSHPAQIRIQLMDRAFDKAYKYNCIEE